MISTTAPVAPQDLGIVPPWLQPTPAAHNSGAVPPWLQISPPGTAGGETQFVSPSTANSPMTLLDALRNR